MGNHRPLLRAYVDETGDRGVSARSSPFFAFAGIVVSDEEDHLLRTAVSTCRQSFNVPAHKPLHWQEHVKVFARRQFVAAQLAAVPAVVNYVIFEKAAIPSVSGMRTDHTMFYNYAAGLMMERLLLTARTWPGGPRDIVVRFAHVRGFDHKRTAAYFAMKHVMAPGWVGWNLLRGAAKFDGIGSYDGLQAADQYAGMLKVAIVPDEFGGYEEQHFLRIRPQIRSFNGKTWNYGFKAMARQGTFPSLPWWASAGI